MKQGRRGRKLQQLRESLKDTRGKIKLKATLEKATKAQRGSRDIATLLL